MKTPWPRPQVVSLVLLAGACSAGDSSDDGDREPAGPAIPPAIALSRGSVSFSATAGGSNPAAQTVAVTNAGGGTLTGLSGFVAHPESSTRWLAGQLSGSTAPATATLQATVGALGNGTYTAYLYVESRAAANSPQSIPVTLTVSGGPGPTPTNPTFLRNGVWITASWTSGKFEGPDTRRDALDTSMPAGSYQPPSDIDLRKRQTGAQFGLFVIYRGTPTLVTYSCVGAGSATQPVTSGIALQACAVDVFDTPFARLRRYAMTTTTAGTIDFMFFTTAGVEIKLLYCRAGYVLIGPPAAAKLECVRQ